MSGMPKAGGAPGRSSLIAIVAVSAILACLGLAGQAQASMEIEAFSTASSDHTAGGHPDLSTSFDLVEPGVEETARNVTFEAPTGIFGNPYAISHCTSSDFALDQCPAGSQAGLITVYANYEGEEHHLLGTAPIFDVEPQGDQTALFAFIVPTLNIPINIPVNVRTATDYGLRFTVEEITQVTPLAGADLVFWGFPADESHDSRTLPERRTGQPGRIARDWPPPAASEQATSAGQPVHPLTDNPTTCAGAARHQPHGRDLPGPALIRPRSTTAIRRSPNATSRSSIRFSTPSPTTHQADSASGLNIELSAPQFLGFANSPSEIRAAS